MEKLGLEAASANPSTCISGYQYPTTESTEQKVTERVITIREKVNVLIYL